MTLSKPQVIMKSGVSATGGTLVEVMVDGTWWRFWMRPHNLGLTCLIPAPVACVPIKACRVRAPRHKTFLLNFEKWREALFQRAEFSQNVITGVGF